MGDTKKVFALVWEEEDIWQFWIAYSKDLIAESAIGSNPGSVSGEAMIQQGTWVEDGAWGSYFFDEFPLHGELKSVVDCVVIPKEEDEVEGTRLEFYETAPDDATIKGVNKLAWVIRGIKVLEQPLIKPSR